MREHALLPVQAGLQLVRLKPRSVWGASANKDIYEPSEEFPAPVHLFTQVHRCCGPQKSRRETLLPVCPQQTTRSLLSSGRRTTSASVAREKWPQDTRCPGSKHLCPWRSSPLQKNKDQKKIKFPLLLLLLLPSAQAVCYFSFAAAGVSALGCKLLTFGETLGLTIQNYRCPAAFKAPERLPTFELQSDSKVWRLCRRATCPPSQPSTPPPSFLPCPPPPPPPWTKKERTCRLWDENLTGGVGFQGVVTVRRYGRLLLPLLVVVVVALCYCCSCCWWYASSVL